MTIHLPHDLEISILAKVKNIYFASVNDAIAEAARLLLHDLDHRRSETKNTPGEMKPDSVMGALRDVADERAKQRHTTPPAAGMGSIRAMQDAADELDEIVADAMKRRREEPWRVIPGE